MNNILESAGGRKVHGIDVDFGEERCWRCDDWGNKDVLCLSRLTDVACLYKPSDVVAHKRPPIAKRDMRVRSEISVVS